MTLVRCQTKNSSWQCKNWFEPDGKSIHCPHHRQLNCVRMEKYRKTIKFKKAKKKYCDSAQGKKKNREDSAKTRARHKFQRGIAVTMSKLVRGKRKESHTVFGSTVFDSEQAIADHLKSTFTDGMTMDNYGYGDDCWHIGHRIPKILYDHSNPEDVWRCWSRANLFAQWQTDNLHQHTKLPEEPLLTELKLNWVAPVKWGCG